MTSNKINEEELTEEDLVVKVYTMKSGEDFLDEDGFPCLSPEKKDKSEAFAKEVIFPSGKSKYYLKRGRYGRLFNPIGLYSEGMSHRQRHGIPEWIYKSSKKETFEYYINFLKTKNIAWLNNAEREL
jgi:hypothetical protein